MNSMVDFATSKVSWDMDAIASYRLPLWNMLVPHIIKLYDLEIICVYIYIYTILGYIFGYIWIALIYFYPKMPNGAMPY